MQNFQSVLAPLGHAAIITVNSSHTFKDIIKSVSQLSEQLEKHCKDEIPRISGDGKLELLIVYTNVILSFM